MKSFIACLLFSIAAGCPDFGPEPVCNDGAILCQYAATADGCPQPGYCMEGYMGMDGTMCPGVCPVDCNWETEMHCDMGYDANGCMLPATCAPLTVPGTNGVECAGLCPMICPEGQIMCSPTPDPAYPCEMPGWCGETCV